MEAEQHSIPGGRPPHYDLGAGPTSDDLGSGPLSDVVGDLNLKVENSKILSNSLGKSLVMICKVKGGKTSYFYIFNPTATPLFINFFWV